MSTNPFDDDNVAPRSRRSGASRYRSSNSSRRIQAQDTGEPAIWAARNVEWPIPVALSLSSFSKLVRASRQAGASLGIASDALAVDEQDEAGGAETQNYNYGFAGLMSRVLNTSGTGSGTGGDEDDILQHDLDGGLASPSSSRSARPLRPPRNRCVAASNGWIIATFECAPTSSGGPLLRLVSRWNVRRGSSSSSGDHLIVLPPPVLSSTRPTASASSTTSPPTPAELLSTRIAHVFVDPTGCHTLLSAKNGEAYYLHSSSRTVQKLTGFGLAPDGSQSGNETGISATAWAATRKNDETGMTAALQTGLSAGSYVTAVAWDKERGTEGSTKKILLGTNIGELYEYYLNSPNQSSEAVSKAPSNDEEDGMDTTSGEAMPVLLHKLHSAESSAAEAEVAAVTGLYFERLSAPMRSSSGATVPSAGGNGICVLAATSGRNKRTRLFTFYSAAGSGGFRSVLSSSSSDANQPSLVELPGSVDFADLRLCGDNFALRTATGIYYGTLDRGRSTGASPSALTGSSVTGGVICDAGILPYEKGASSTASIPVSIALTPHHLITLSESSEVRFINRVAQKVIQKERVDWVAMSPSNSGAGPTSSVDENLMGFGELMMDIRRPDQVWLRKARALVHISSSCEDRDVWKFTLSKCLDFPQSSRGGASKSRAFTGRPEIVTRQPSLTGVATIPVLTEEEKVQEALFEHAKSLCSNTVQKAVVTAVRAEYHLSQGRAELAAKYLAQCPPTLAPFASTSIRLALPMLGIDDPKGYGYSSKAKKNLHESNLALITYLGDKMRVAKMNDDSVACTMVGAWLTELYLNERESALGTGLGQFDVPDSDSPARRAKEASNHAMLDSFLSSYVENLDAKTIMRILSSHDVSAPECASFATASGDISTAVNAALCIGSDDTTGARDALLVLDEAPFEMAEPFYYRHAVKLLCRAPIQASKSFLERYLEGLSPTKLLPSIMTYERKRAEYEKQGDSNGDGNIDKFNTKRSRDEVTTVNVERDSRGVEVHISSPDLSLSGSFVNDDSASTKYLEGVIELGCRSTAIFNYLISLYAAMVEEETLFRFLSIHVPASATVADATRRTLLSRDGRSATDDILSAPLDMSYALRTILATGRHYRSAIKLYMGFGMRQQAIELALKVDPNLARELARDAVGAEERKRLWLMIARNAAAEGGGDKDVVDKVVSVLKDCGPNILTIEDVLPFLPDFAQIDQIKDEISDALTAYSSKIEGLLNEMQDGDQTCDALRDEISRLSSHRMQMKSDARCALTNKIVLDAAEPFYVFPSGYVVLESALKEEVMPYLTDKQQARVEEIVKQLQRLRLNGEKSSSEVSTGDEPRIDELQFELDGLIGAECPLTGSIMVDSIDVGFEASMDEDDGIWESQPVVQATSSGTLEAERDSYHT